MHSPLVTKSLNDGLSCRDTHRWLTLQEPAASASAVFESVVLDTSSSAVPKSKPASTRIFVGPTTRGCTDRGTPGLPGGVGCSQSCVPEFGSKANNPASLTKRSWVWPSTDASCP